MAYNNDLKLKISPEHELLLCCARTYIDEKTEVRIVSRVENGIDWECLTDLALQHRLVNLLYFQLNNICPESIPKNVLGNLRDIFNINVRSNLFLTGELIRILEILKSKGINGIPYKGPSLAILVYKNIALRQFTDLDIFIHKSDVLKVKNILNSNGYKLYHDLEYIKGYFYIKTQREYTFINEKTNAVVEIHWNFHGAFISLPEGYECLYNDLETLNLNGFSVPSIKIENLILILCIHCANHDWESLSWVCDISELIKAHEDIDWQYLIETAQKLGIKRIFLVNILLVNKLWKIEIPETLSNHINSDQSIYDLLEVIEQKIFFEDEILFNFPKKAIFDFKKRESVIYGIKDVIRTLLMPTYIDFVDIRLPAFLYPLYYIIRPALLFRRLRFKPVHNTQNKL